MYFSKPGFFKAPFQTCHRGTFHIFVYFYIAETEKLEDLLVFAVGLRKIPPLGLHPPPNIKFNHRQEAQHIVVADFPYADTCANTLRLPMATNYASFKTNMLAAINTVKIFTDEQIVQCIWAKNSLM